MDINFSEEAIYWIRGYLSGDGHALGRMASAKGAEQPPEPYEKIADDLCRQGITIEQFDEMIRQSRSRQR
jgi:hypothetical protein